MCCFSFSKSLLLVLTVFLTACGGSYGGGGNNGGGGGGGTPPGVPTSFTATAGDAQVALSWTAVSGATSYHVKRSTISGSGYAQVSAPTGTSFTDTGLTNRTTYYYVVSAVNTYGETATAEKSATPVAVVADVTVTVNPGLTKPISPWIYGINSYGGTPNPPHVTMDRAGGNRWTAYNWENNASNAGNDFNYQSDNFLCHSPSCSETVPAEGVRTLIIADNTAGLASLITVQLQGLVSADKSGPVSTANPPDMTRFKTVVDKKNLITATAFTTLPDTSDANVYMDEFLWALDQKLPGRDIFGASPAHPTFVSLDNEPELWNTTHLEVQGPTIVSPSDYITKTIDMTQALKDQFPNLVIFGPAHYGFAGIYSWQGEVNAHPNSADWFPDMIYKP